MELNYKSYAKINLALDVLDKRKDGYHNIKTVFQEIDLHDNLFIMDEEGDEFTLSCDNKLLPIGEDNIMYKAWQLVKEYHRGNHGVRVHLNKNIPIAAGLAGGSSNGACMINALNDLWNLNLSKDQMMDIGARLGADLPFFFVSGTCLGSGKGTELVKLKPFSQKHVLIVNNGIGVSTKYVYEHIKLDDNRINIDSLVQGLENDKQDIMYKNMKNKLEEVTVSLQPDIEKIKNIMLEFGAKVSLMCGSGPTVFGIFDDEVELEKAFFYFKDKYELVFSCMTR